MNAKRLLIALFFGLLVATPTFAQSAETDDVIGKRMALLEKDAPYLAKVYSAFSVTTPQGSGMRFGGGSGFLYVDEQNRCGIYTNNHVIGPVTNRYVYVVLNGQPYGQKIRVVSRDPLFDLALLECPVPLPEHQVSAKLGTAADIHVGQIVYAVGYPFGVHSVTYGRINATESMVGPYLFTNQAPLSPGNSGGPLFAFTDAGEPVVVGVNTASSVQGLQSHTIHIDHIHRLMPRLWEGESTVLHGALQMGFENIRDVNPMQFQIIANASYPPTQQKGLIVLGVQRGSSAGIADIEPGDVIVGLEQDGKEVPFSNSSEFFIEIVTRKPGDTVKLKILRNGEFLEKTLQLDEFPISTEQEG